jgi:hypothetical protein
MANLLPVSWGLGGITSRPAATRIERGHECSRVPLERCLKIRNVSGEGLISDKQKVHAAVDRPTVGSLL